jgi:hypothetical protein
VSTNYHSGVTGNIWQRVRVHYEFGQAKHEAAGHSDASWDLDLFPGGEPTLFPCVAVCLLEIVLNVR